MAHRSVCVSLRRNDHALPEFSVMPPLVSFASREQTIISHPLIYDREPLTVFVLRKRLTQDVTLEFDVKQSRDSFQFSLNNLRLFSTL